MFLFMYHYFLAVIINEGVIEVFRGYEEMCDARNPQRVRLLAGKDPSCGELRERVEKLQVVYVYCTYTCTCTCILTIFLLICAYKFMLSCLENVIKN